MTPSEIETFERLLLALQRDILKKGTQRIEPNRTDDAKVGGDEDEQPLNEMLQSIASSRNRNNEAVLARVRRALAKLQKNPDDFGLCESCEEEIEAGRLKAMPYSELCVDCQSKRDPRGPTTRRALTEYLD